MKTCIDCKETKDETEFYCRKKDSQYRQSKCKLCSIADQKEYISKNRHKSYEYSLKQRYGLTIETFNKLRLDQADMCAICGEFKPLQVDHCHTGGQVRGLLCGECNLALGKFKDDPLLLKAAITYLERHVSSD